LRFFELLSILCALCGFNFAPFAVKKNGSLTISGLRYSQNFSKKDELPSALADGRRID
jgi:hypothetical protein